MHQSAPYASLGEKIESRPVFISGVYRSSSTFLAALVGCHEQYWYVRFDKAAALKAAQWDGASYASLYDALMRQNLLDNGGGDVEWIDKTAVLWSKIPHFLSMFPNGKVINVLRDPRSVYASYKKMTNEPGYTYLYAAFNSIQSVRRSMADFGTDRIMLLKSEDLLSSPQHYVEEI